jgi:hypothetical protein
MIQSVSIAVFAVMTSVAAKNIKRTICLVLLCQIKMTFLLSGFVV